MMELTGTSDSWFDTVVHGNKKFTGGVGDEDEIQPEHDEKWREYCLDLDSVTKIICTHKLNGEAAHFSGR